MPYTAEISRANPTCFLFLIDQSESMTEPIRGGAGKPKGQAVADATNRLLQTLVLRCAKGATVLDRFQVGVIGYGASVGPAFGGTLAGRKRVLLSELANNPLRVERQVQQVDDGAGGKVDKVTRFPVWFDPVSAGKTPMCEALNLAWHVLAEYLIDYPGCYPPLVVNVTDGKSTDGDPLPVAGALTDLASTDGKVLLFNLHVSARTARTVEFPDDEADLPDDFARQLFRMSSLLPLPMLLAAKREGLAVSDATRGFAYNADLTSVVRFLDIGTRVGGPGPG